MQHLNVGSNVLTTRSFRAEWQELYQRLARLLIIFLLTNGGLWYHYDILWDVVLAPVQQATGASVVILSLSSPFFRTVQLILWLSFCFNAPYMSWELAAFVFPGLHQKEKRSSILMITLFFIVFYIGQWFCWQYAIPWSLSFFVAFNKQIAQPVLDFDKVVDYVLILQQAFFILALWPQLLLIAVQQGFLKRQRLIELRGTIYVGSFIIGMLLTPPDCFAQCCLAVPLIILYELVLVVAVFLQPSQCLD